MFGSTVSNSHIKLIIEYQESSTLSKITRSLKHYVLLLPDIQTTVTLKRMVSSEPNSKKQRAVSKSSFITLPPVSHLQTDCILLAAVFWAVTFNYPELMNTVRQCCRCSQSGLSFQTNSVWFCLMIKLISASFSDEAKWYLQVWIITVVKKINQNKWM